MKNQLLTFGILLLSSSLFGRLDPIQPVRTDLPPKIDGVLDDQIWISANTLSGFRTFVPDFEKEMPFETTVYMAYDRENLYFAFRCDDDPSKIKTSLSPRDKIRPDDWVCLNIDFFNDQQSIFSFYVNPSGIQMDANYSAGNEDYGIDIVWYSAAQINEDGYDVEIQIPFKSIRYANADVVEMGAIFERKISRFSIQGTYPAMDPKQGFNFLNQTLQLQYEDIEQYTLIELLPAVTYSKTSTLESGKLTSPGGEADVSLTAKLGITSNLILDATLNPDFSQVEADAGRIDINERFPIFFEEKRPFFLEGNENFNFAGVSMHDPLRSVVHTRSIVNPIAATKLSGRVGKNNSLASILAVDKLYPEEEGEVDQKPFISVFRYKRRLKDDSFIGAVYTGREFGDAHNRVAGADAMIRLSPASAIQGYFVKSFNEENGVSTDGHASVITWEYDARKWSFSALYYTLSEDFNTDIGFLGRTGYTKLRAGIGHKFYFDSNFLKKISLDTYLSQAKDIYSDLWEFSNFFMFNATFISNTSIHMTFDWQNEIYEGLKYNTNELRIRLASQISKGIHVSGSYGRANRIRYVENPFSGYAKSISSSLTFQIAEKFHSSMDWNFSDFYRDSDDGKEFEISIFRSRNTFQLNKYLFLRGIIEYNTRREALDLDFLASFTYIPGTVIHLGYGSLYEKTRWNGYEYIPDDNFIESERGIFFKASYLWRF